MSQHDVNQPQRLHTNIYAAVGEPYETHHKSEHPKENERHDVDHKGHDEKHERHHEDGHKKGSHGDTGLR